jgi:uncharacterized OB-fold protein
VSPALLPATPPLPVPQEWDEERWVAAAEGRLVVQRCTGCGELHGLPRPMCSQCQSFEHDWVQCAGTATLYTWTTVYRPFHPAFAAMPLTLGIVALDDHPEVHMATNLAQLDPEDPRLRMDAPLAAVFEPIPGTDLVLPQFELSEPDRR